MGEDTPPPVFEDNQPKLAEALDSGQKLADIMNDSSWGQMELSSGSGLAILGRVDPRNTELTVISSEDSNLRAGDVIVIDGATVSGGLTAPGVIAPSTRLAIRRQIKLSGKAEDGSLEEMLVFDPTPMATGFISHVALVGRGEDGEDKTRYLF